MYHRTHSAYNKPNNWILTKLNGKTTVCVCASARENKNSQQLFCVVLKCGSLFWKYLHCNAWILLYWTLLPLSSAYQPPSSSLALGSLFPKRKRYAFIINYSIVFYRLLFSLNPISRFHFQIMSIEAHTWSWLEWEKSNQANTQLRESNKYYMADLHL